MNPLIYLIVTLIDLYSFVVLVWVILSLLVYFNVVNMNNRFVSKLYEVVFKLTEPALRRIRRFMPDLGGLDLSPVILLVGLNVLKYTVVWLFVSI